MARTVRDLCTSGRHEPLKAAVHGALGALAAVCLAYNVAAWFLRDRPGRHLARNVVVYAGIAALELGQVRRHLR